MFVASGVRYDLAERSPEFVRELAAHHTGGQLSVAPEHTNPRVLEKMKKPGIESYERFADSFCKASEQAGKEQYLIPYFITGHPGSTLATGGARPLSQAQRHAGRVRFRTVIPTPMSTASPYITPGSIPFTRSRAYRARAA